MAYNFWGGKPVTLKLWGGFFVWELTENNSTDKNTSTSDRVPMELGRYAFDALIF